MVEVGSAKDMTPYLLVVLEREFFGFLSDRVQSVMRDLVVQFLILEELERTGRKGFHIERIDEACVESVFSEIGDVSNFRYDTR